MGWSGGSEIFGSIADSLKAHVKSDKLREKIYRELIPEFESADCDNLGECAGLDVALDKVLREFELVHDEESDVEEGGGE